MVKSIVKLILLLLILSEGFQNAVIAQQKHPNVVMISVDDMKDWAGYLRGYEGTVFTPHMDHLASEGIAFTNAHAAAPLCNPSRTALLLGKYPSTTGIYGNNQWWKANYPEEVPLPQYFKNHGYYTAGAGKIFHHTPGFNPPVSWNEFQDQVFDDPWIFAEWDPARYFLQYGYRGQILKYPDWYPLNAGRDFNIRAPMDWGSIPGKNDEDYGDVAVVQYAKEFLDQKHDNPFFLALGIYRPHVPWYVPQKYFDQYPIDQIVLPGAYKEDDLSDIPQVGKEIAANGSKDFYRIREEGKWKDAVQAYLASISFADDQTGAILKALEESNYYENTIIIFWSDHGWHLGSKDHWHKQTLWEEATKVPFIIKAPGITQPGLVCDYPVDLVSVYKTLLSLCGLPDKPDLDGHDLMPLIKKPDMQWEYPAVTEHGFKNIAVRSRNWRYIRYHDGQEELYNHRKDPNEWMNLAEDQENEEILDQLRQWIPKKFTQPVSGKGNWYFDPHQYTFLNRETGEFIEGNK